jgi:hypothetical protein
MKSQPIKMNTPIFLHREINVDGFVTYNTRKTRFSTKDTVKDLYFIPNDQAVEKRFEIRAELHRGALFSTLRDGFLFGAQLELRKYGNLVKVQVN